jgi:hypothetical protein
MKQELVHFLVGSKKETFSIHRDLLDANEFDWAWAGDCGYMQTDNTGQYPELDFVSPCVFRGFIQWLYCGQLPTEDMIKSFAYPEVWDNGQEDESLACSMAHELYILGCGFGMLSLQRKTMAYLTNSYESAQQVPSLAWVEFIDRFDKEELWLVYVDLYAKFYAKNDAGRDFWILHRDFLNLPEKFREEVLKRVGEGN